MSAHAIARVLIANTRHGVFVCLAGAGIVIAFVFRILLSRRFTQSAAAAAALSLLAIHSAAWLVNIPRAAFSRIGKYFKALYVTDEGGGRGDGRRRKADRVRTWH